MKYIEKLKMVTDNLENCEKVSKYSTKEENQADTLANAFLDIEESIQIIKEQIPNLYKKKLTNDEVEELILDIGEELRHIMYHINDSKVYDYLKMEN